MSNKIGIAEPTYLSHIMHCDACDNNLAHQFQHQLSQNKQVIDLSEPHALLNFYATLFDAQGKLLPKRASRGLVAKNGST